MLSKLVAMKDGLHVKWLHRKVVAKEDGCYLQWKLIARESVCQERWSVYKGSTLGLLHRRSRPTMIVQLIPPMIKTTPVKMSNVLDKIV